MSKWDLFKLLYSEGKYRQIKRRPTEWEEIFDNYRTDKGLIVNIYKQLIQLNIQKSPPN